MASRELALLADLETGGAITPAGMVLPATTTFEQWEAVGHLLRAIVRATPWLVGDHYVFGEAAFGTRAEGADMYGVNPDTVSTYAWVARRIPLQDRKIPQLTFTQHRLVAAMPPKQRDTWLERAERKGWSTKDMRAALLVKRLTVGADADSSHQPESAEAPSYTPREALVAIRGDETWRKVADSALAVLDETEGEEIVCPNCGSHFLLPMEL